MTMTQNGLMTQCATKTQCGSRYDQACQLGALAALALLVGCAHESVASPVTASTSTDTPIPAKSSAAAPAEKPQASEPVEQPEPAVAEISAPAKEQPPEKKGRPAPADRSPVLPGEGERITFEDLIIGMPANVVYRPFMLTDRAKELEGQKISIIGFMHGGATGTRIKEFVLLKNTECKFGAEERRDHFSYIRSRQGRGHTSHRAVPR
jgi:hypothetical protein